MSEHRRIRLHRNANRNDVTLGYAFLTFLQAKRRFAAFYNAPQERWAGLMTLVVVAIVTVGCGTGLAVDPEWGDPTGGKDPRDARGSDRSHGSLGSRGHTGRSGGAAGPCTLRAGAKAVR